MNNNNPFFLTGLIGFASLLFSLNTPFVNAHVLDCPCPQIIAHRGASGEFPQGTWLAFQNALDMNTDVLELDVHMSKDNHIIIHHDADLEATTGDPSDIEDLTLQEIKGLDAGFTFTTDGGQTYPYRGFGLQILTIPELFSFFPNEKFSIEIKPNSTTLAQAVIDELINNNLMEEAIIASVHSSVLDYVRDSPHSIVNSASAAEITGHTLLWSIGLGFLINPKYDVAQLPKETTAESFIERLQSKGVAVQVWTVNNRSEIGDFLDRGVDGVIGNYPDRIFDEMVLRGMR
jgi:glycerophosphoryl diester phosphodiesterase